jgi:hypothetical protein
MKYVRLAIPLIFTAFTTQAALTTQSYALCRPGTVVECTFLGKPGTKTCLGDGEFDACVTKATPPPPAAGTVFGKYLILTVIYAPPGTTAPQTITGEQSFSQVSYESDSTTGSTKTNTKSFKQDYQVSLKSDCDVCFLNGGASFEYTRNKTSQDALNINKKTTSIITDPGPVEDAVDHNLDQIWLFLHPKYDVTIDGSQVTWELDPDQSAGLVQYAYTGWLKDPSKIPPEFCRTFRPPESHRLIIRSS